MTSVSLECPLQEDAARFDRAVFSRVALSALSVACIVVAIVSRLAYLYEPFGGDGAMFAYMGKLVSEGGRFGTDLIDNKFPTAGLMTVPFWRAFGTCWAGYVLTQLAMTFLACAMLARSAGRAIGSYATLPTFLLGITLLNLNAAVMGGFQLETIQTFFACLAAACALEAMRDGRSVLPAIACGLAAGCATLVKPTGGAVLAAGILALALQRQKRQVAGVLIGWLLPMAVAVLYLHVSDQLKLIPDIASQISEYASGSSFEPFDLFRPLSLLALFGAALLIRGWVYRRPRHRVGDEKSAAIAMTFAIAWLFLEFVGVLMQRRMYAYHFLPLAAPAALVFAAIPRRVNAVQLAGVLAIPLAFSIWGAIAVAGEKTDDEWQAVTKWLDDHCLPGERIWRDQTPYVLRHSDLRPASRIQLTFIFMNSDHSAGRFASMLIDDLKASRARYVVLPADVEAHIHTQTTRVMELARIPRRAADFAIAWHSIERYVETNYEPVVTIGMERIYCRR